MTVWPAVADREDLMDLGDVLAHDFTTPVDLPRHADLTPITDPALADKPWPLGPVQPIDPPGLPAPKYDLARITQLTNEVVALAAEVPGQLAALHRAVLAARIARGEA